MTRAEQFVTARALGDATFDRARLDEHLRAGIACYQWMKYDPARMRRAAAVTLDVFEQLPGDCLAGKWARFESDLWPCWVRGQDRPALGDYWAWGAWMQVTSRLVRPGWAFLNVTRTSQWVAKLPQDDPLAEAMTALRAASERLTFGKPELRAVAVNIVLRMMLHHGVDDLAALKEEHAQPTNQLKGGDVVDALLFELGVFDRTPQRGILRRLGMDRHDPMDLPAVSGVPEAFQPVCGL